MDKAMKETLRLTWKNMISRCHNPAAHNYRNYGGRGIAVCAQWRDSFESFAEYMGPRPDGTSIDRIDNDGDYEPGNCQWAEYAIQHRNRRTVWVLTANGESKTIEEWSREVSVHAETIRRRKRAGMSDHDAIFKQRRNGNQHSRKANATPTAPADMSRGGQQSCQAEPPAAPKSQTITENSQSACEAARPTLQQQLP